jgi:hypothetical protein
MSDSEVIAAIRACHLKANIGWIEDMGRRPKHQNGRPIVIHWDQAWVDPGGTIFGHGPYLHVPITNYWSEDEETVHRVYAPARLQRRLAKRWCRRAAGAEKVAGGPRAHVGGTHDQSALPDTGRVE